MQDFLILAQVEAGSYVSIWKVLPVVVILLLWARILTFMDKDAIDAHLPRHAINSGMIVGLVGGFFAFLFLPNFWVALSVLLLVLLVEIGVYLLMASLNDTWTIRENGVERVHGYASTYLPGTLDLGGASRITVGLGQKQNAGDLSMVPGRMANVTGTVVNSRGEPSVGETVYVTRELRTAGGVSRTEQGGSLVQADGSFVIRNLAPGDYKLAVRDVETEPNTHVAEAAIASGAARVPLDLDEYERALERLRPELP